MYLPHAGYRVVLDNGDTPDLVTRDDMPVIKTRDTRANTQICQEHLMALQCVRCSVDQSTIVGRKGYRVQPDKWYNKSLAAEKRPQTIFFMEYAEPVPGGSSGEPMVLCQTYFDQLIKFCHHLTIRGETITDSMSADYFTDIPFGLISTGPSIPRNETIRSRPSSDGFDYLLTSDRNCYTRPLPVYQEPECVYLVNKEWKSPFERPTEVVDQQMAYFVGHSSQLHPARSWASFILPVILLVLLAIHSSSI
ncbi:hypothetical protein SAMD00019534_046090 [Acytostelium subglobosum LB1]|uniref:hypothetical protein n=1 Tax=Acytostelium subglobosum LB1 TaxID=1410327 RepID=UPI000645236E|nr:hypothetical protein SAMD00019534_046090 [Acytostelium subglobosum LB1]GAM21434.1 hypothetical protein SAMD00019534_046090 [Acytostelium subglobosum LB1]|eukprot:XP_012755553.1 hypothetical protein SAMD00019534_046090 [Acytostelium subglobosum LB1]